MSSKLSWPDSGYCEQVPKPHDCVLWGVPWQYALLSGFTLGLAVLAHWVVYVVFALLGLVLKRTRNRLPDLRKPCFSAVLWLARTGFLWAAYVALRVPNDVADVLDHVIPLPFCFALAKFANDACDAAAASQRASSDPGSTDSYIYEELWRVGKYVAFIVVVVLTFQIEGVDVVTFLKTATLLGLLLVFSVQPWMRNLVGGLVLFHDKKFVLNDRVKVIGLEGVVSTITLRTTTLRTDDGSLLYVPNSRITENSVVTLDSETGTREIVVRLQISQHISAKDTRELLEALEATLRTLHPSLTCHVLREHPSDPSVVLEDVDRIRMECHTSRLSLREHAGVASEVVLGIQEVVRSRRISVKFLKKIRATKTSEEEEEDWVDGDVDDTTLVTALYTFQTFT